MKKALLTITCAVFLLGIQTSQANADPKDKHGKWHEDRHSRGHYDNRRGRDWDHWRERNWRGRHYDYNPYYWQRVNVYTQPEYYDDYREVRCTNSSNPFGVLLGAGLGGLAGSTIGSGSGRTAAIAGGAVLGGLIGNEITTERCSTHVFREVPLGRPVSWQKGPREAYAFVPVREFDDDNGRYCREYQGYATINGRRSETYGTACMQPDGSWQIIN